MAALLANGSVKAAKMQLAFAVASKRAANVSAYRQPTYRQPTRKADLPVWKDYVGPGKLTPAEAREIQQIANKYGTTIYVFGSRANGQGRNVDRTDLPVGKGEHTRSDIDMRHDGEKDIATRGTLSHELSRIGNGAGKSQPYYVSADQYEPKGGFLKFEPE